MTTSSWHQQSAAAMSHARHGRSGCRRDAHDEERMAQATSTKCAVMIILLVACAPENLIRSSQPDREIVSARQPRAHSDSESERGRPWGRELSGPSMLTHFLIRLPHPAGMLGRAFSGSILYRSVRTALYLAIDPLIAL
jgi:hypothetical protein